MGKLISFLFFVSMNAFVFGQEPAPAMTIASTRANPYISTARQADQIQQNFPYDIALRTAGGDTLNSAEAFVKNGKPTILLFWLTTCGPCRLELAALSEKYETWKAEADFNLYAISIDFPKNYGQFVKRVEDSHWPFAAFYDLNQEFGIIMPGRLNGLPQTFILDKDGNIVHHKRKFIPGDEEMLFEQIKALN